MKKFFSIAVMPLLTFVVPIGVWAQAVSGKIEGHVGDPNGGSIANAMVTITEVERGMVSTSRTNEAGNFLEGHLLAGQYRVRIEAEGFSGFETKVEVHVDASTEVNAQLKVGNAETVVTVTDAAPLLKTDRADVSTILSSTELQSLPILDRNVTQVTLTIPGTQMNDWQHSSAENPQGGIQFSANGQQFTHNGFLLDGTENNSSGLGIAVINPNIDSLEEFKVTTSNYDAEFGSVAGALMQATTRSGTNQWHGTLFEYLRNGQFDASDPFAGSLPLHWNEFGGSAGAPIRKDRVFFFTDYQGTRRHTGAPVVTTVPTSAERLGNLQALLGSYICADGSTSTSPCGNALLVNTTEGSSIPAQQGMVFDPTTGDPISGSGRLAITSGGQPNILPSVSTAITKLLQYIPAANYGDQSLVANNYLGKGIDQFTDDQVDVRVDATLSSRSHLFGRYTISDFSKQAPGAYGDVAGGPALNGSAFAGTSNARNQSVALGHSYVVSSSLVAETRLGFYRYRIRTQPNGLGTTPATDAGIPGLNLGTEETSGMPAFYVNGNGGFTFGYANGVNQCNCPLKETENHFQFVSNWTKTVMNHTIVWGVDLRRLQQQRIPSDSHRAGEVTFIDSGTGSADVDAVGVNSGATTGVALASFLLGVPNQFVRYFTGATYHAGLRQTRLFSFVQDSWRATPKLTLNYGVRYENYLPQTAASRGGAGSFDPNTGDLLAAGIGTVPANMGVKPYNIGFAPRVGIAYELPANTVIRAGYGSSFTPAGLGAVFGQSPEYDAPITIPQQLSPNSSYSAVFDLFQGPPVPASLPIPSSGRTPLPDGLQVYFFFNPPSSYRVPLVQFWNLALQHEFSSTLSLEASYVGNVGRHLYVNANVNQAVPGPGDFNGRRLYYQKFGLTQGLYSTCNCDNSSYNGLQVKVQKKATRGLDLLFAYSYGHALDNTEYGSAYDNNLNYRADHGSANFDRKHSVAISNVWQLPIGRGNRVWGNAGRVVNLFVGDWVFNGITNLASGRPFTANVSNTASVNADFNNVRADQVGNPHVAHPNRNMWFDPTAFTDPQQLYRDGTSRRNGLRGPSEVVFNLSLAKTFTVVEGKTVEFHWENFNAFNHVNLGQPGNIVDQSGAGQITSTGEPMRQMQFGLHFRF